MFLRVVGNRCAKFETGQTFSYGQTDATTPNNAGVLLVNKKASVCTGLSVALINAIMLYIHVISSSTDMGESLLTFLLL